MFSMNDMIQLKEIFVAELNKRFEVKNHFPVNTYNIPSGISPEEVMNAKNTFDEKEMYQLKSLFSSVFAENTIVGAKTKFGR